MVHRSISPAFFNTLKKQASPFASPAAGIHVVKPDQPDSLPQSPPPPVRRLKLGMLKAILLSMALHVTLPVAAIVVSMVLAFFGIDLSPKTAVPPRPKDLEFVLVPPQVPTQRPTDTQTRFRATRDTVAAGRHRPDQPVHLSESPTSKPSVTVVQSTAKPAQKSAEKPLPKPQAAKPRPLPTQPNATVATDTENSSQAPASAGDISNPPVNGNNSDAPSVDALQQADLGPYVEALQRRIKQSWTPPRGNESKRVVVLFQVSRDGRLNKVEVTESSGEPEADAAAIAAIQKTFPFRPLPVEVTEPDIDIEFTFDYKVFGDKRRLEQADG